MRQFAYARKTICVLIALACVAAFVPMWPVTVRAEGATITVNESLTDDIGTPNSRKCTLRSAINAVNTATRAGSGCDAGSGTGLDRIVFGFTSTTQVQLLIALPPLVRGVMVTGDAPTTGYIPGGPPQITVFGDESFPIFSVSDALPAGETVTLDALAITRGGAASCALPGGGIVNRGRLAVTRSSIVGNFGCAGAGIGNTGTLTIENTAIRDNGGATTERGAGLHTSGGTATLTNVSFTGNSATGNGGAMHATAPATLSNATFAANTAGGNGGAVYADHASGVVSLVHATVAGNTAADGGGLVRAGAGGVSLSRVAVAGNTATGSGGGDVRGIFTAGSYNFVGRADGGSGFGGTDRTGTAALPRDPLLLAPGDHGGDGPVRIVPPRPDSPLVDAAPCLAGVTTDGRGGTFSRPQGMLCDIGAFEVRHIPIASGANTIQTTLTALPTNSGSAILDLAAGTYTGQVMLPSGIALGIVGASASGSVLDGGGTGPVLRATGGFAALSRLTVRGGAGSGAGGVLIAGGTVVFSECIVTENAGANAAVAVGNGGTLAVAGCAITANTRGGGVANDGTLSLVNSTVSGNNVGGSATGAPVRVAGIMNGASNPAARLTLTHTTVAGNTAPATDPGFPVAYMAGVHNLAPATNVTVAASILAGNVRIATGGATEADDANGAFTSGGGNVIGSVGGTGFGVGDTLPAPGATLDAKLLPLAPHASGAAPAHAPRPNSPALDAATCAAGVAPDARGTTRPRGAACDSGAVEYTPLPPTLLNATAPRDGGVITLTGTGFQRGTTLTVGGVSAPVTATNDDGTSLTAAVPSHPAGGVPIAATNPVGLVSNPATLTYQPGAAVGFTVTGPAGIVSAGTTHTVTVVARDRDGAVANGYRGTVRLRVTGGAATLPAAHTFTAGDGGTHAFPVTLRSVGATTVVAEDTGNAALSGASGGFTVVPAITALGPRSGSVGGGTVVVVRGAGFAAGGTVVSVGGMSLPAERVVVASDTELRLTMPPRAAGAVALAVTVGGLTATLPNAYTYGIVSPAPMPARAAASSVATPPRPVPVPRPGAAPRSP